MSNHPIVHIEFSSLNREASAAFYQNLFGWQVRQIPEMDYATFDSGEGSVGGGFNPVHEQNPAGTVTVYVNTDDIRATLAQVVALGGKAISDPMPIPGVGLFAYFQDPTGNTLALLEPHMDQQ